MKWRFWIGNVVFGGQTVPKATHRLFVIAHFHPKLVAARVRMLPAIAIFRARLTAYTHREVSFWAENDGFGGLTVPKPMRRLLVIAPFHRKLVSARVRMLLAIGVFRARLTAYTHREVAFWAENCVFGRQTVSKRMRRLLVIAHFQRNWCQLECVYAS